MEGDYSHKFLLMKKEQLEGSGAEKAAVLNKRFYRLLLRKWLKPRPESGLASLLESEVSMVPSTQDPSRIILFH